MAKTKFYVVWKGYNTGIFKTWDECLKNVSGYNGAQYKSFESLQQATDALKSGFSFSPNKIKKSSSTPSSSSIIMQSLSVDAACSGNPGVMEYQGVDTQTKEVWFHQKYELGTNNIGEFLAIVHGLAELKRRNLNIPIYTDSKTALSWIRQKKCKTKLERNPKTEELFKIIERAETWLNSNSWPQLLLKWETEKWGEIPADFGRK
jgi:ribonuclease HI